MSKYIDAEKFVNSLSNCKEGIHDEKYSIDDLICLVESEPAADVEPVVHAHWYYCQNGMDWGLGAYLCSNCHTRNNNLPTNTNINPLTFAGSHYCPQCGARMDEEPPKEKTNE